MRTNKFFAIFAFLWFASFFGIIVIFVPRIDLSIIILIGLALVGYDLWDQLFRRR